MKTSSIVAAAVLSLAMLNPAIAGGRIAFGRPGVFPAARMVGAPINPGARAFGTANRFGRFDHLGFANGPGPRFGRFEEFGPRRQFGGAGFFSLAYGAPALAPAYASSEPSTAPVIFAPSYVTLVSAGPRCGSGDAHWAGGPKIIEIGPSRPDHGVKLPVVIYGTNRGCA